MKLQKLTIKNLASIEDAVIDFENGLLSEESLFLICGETGAGKTSGCKTCAADGQARAGE